jgi:ATP-dependent DNA helicase RecG
MVTEKLKTVLAVGETVAVEFKRCGNGIGADTYQTVCAFLNRFGGDIYLGVENDGTVIGVPESAAPDMVKNFIKMVSNPDVINPTVYLAPEIIEYERKQIVHIRIPPSSEVHSYKKVIYDRVDDSDVKVTATGQIALLYVRKQNIFTERRVFKHITDADLRLDMLPRLVQRAINHNLGSHPWESMSVPEIFQSARLITKDAENGIPGYNLAAVMLLGRDDVIKDICPTHRTDALLRKVNTDRYDDRFLVETNLIDSFDMLMGFAEKHLWDKFYLENDTRVSLRNAIAREMLVNSLMHREFSSTYIAKFIIERDRMYTENANRAASDGRITPENLEPNPKNPIIAAFFRNIGLADELGSGVRNLYKYGRLYSGKAPELIDGDVFRIIVPLDDSYSFDAGADKAQINHSDFGINFGINFGKDFGINETQQKIVALMVENPAIISGEIAESIGITKRQVELNISKLKSLGVIERKGARKNGHWIVK